MIDYQFTDSTATAWRKSKFAEGVEVNRHRGGVNTNHTRAKLEFTA